MEKQFDVLCVGAAVIDIPLQPVSKNIFDVESYPLQQISMTIGGDAINESTVISRLGHKTALATMVGDDAAGQYIIQHCQREGICVEGIRTKENIDTSINNAASELTSSIQKNIQKIRQDRQNQKTEEELQNMEARLSFLQTDTSNANQKNILDSFIVFRGKIIAGFLRNVFVGLIIGLPDKDINRGKKSRPKK